LGAEPSTPSLELGTRKVDAVVICIFAVAVVNIGLGFALAAYLARQYRHRVVEGVSGTPANSGYEGLEDHAAVRERIPGPVARADRSAAAKRDPIARTVDGLRAQVQECNDQLTGLESQVLRSAPPDSCGEAHSR